MTTYPAYWPYTRRTSIRRDLYVLRPPSVEPISLELARQHLRLETMGSPAVHEDDTLIQEIYLPAAREACEQYLGASLAPQTLEYVLDAFPPDRYYAPGREIDLPFGPVIGIDAIIYKAGNIDTSFADYNFAAYGDRVRLTQGSSWPNTDDYPNAVTIRYEAGYSLPGASPDFYPLPAALRSAILLTLAQIYDNCVQGTTCDITELPAGVHYLLDPYVRRMRFA